MTTLNVALSTKLQKTLGQAGVWAEAVYFDTAGTAHWTPLVNDGTVQGNLAIDLPQMKGGKVYFLINSGTAGQTTSPLQSVITKESDISVASAQANDFRFDSFEFTLQGDPSDQGNMTSVVGFGIPMGVSIKYQDPAKPVATLGYNTSGADLFKAIQAIHPDSTSLVFGFSAGPLATASPAVYRYAVSPSNSAQVTDPPFAASDWNAYLGDLLATGGTVGRLSGIFNGAADANGIWHNQGFFNYTITVDGTDFWLEPESNSQIRGYVKISKDELAKSIYSTEGNAWLYTQKTDATPYQILKSDGPAMNVGQNNQWGELFTQFLTGLSAGFYGGVTGRSPNPAVTDTVVLADNWNWDPTYAFGPDGQVSGKSAHWTSDPYSQIFFDNSNSYGSGYSDNLMSRYSEGGPLISLGDLGGNVANINLMLYDDQDTPLGSTHAFSASGMASGAPVITTGNGPANNTGFIPEGVPADTSGFIPDGVPAVPPGMLSPDALSGYTRPVMHNYLPATGTGYAVGTDTTGANLSFSLANPAGTAAGATSWVADDTLTAVSFSFQTNAGWKTVTLDKTSGGTDGLWQNWSIQRSASGDYSIAPVAGSSMSTGNFIISQLPVSLDTNAVSWFKIGVSNTGTHDQKVFNLYTTSTNGNFLTTPGSLAIDGGALTTITPGAPTQPTFNINFFPGAGNAIDPDLFMPGGQTSGTTPMFGTPTSPVAGALAADTFKALANQAAANGSVITTSQDHLAFGWTGLNTVAATADWIKTYSNKISAQNTALITYTPAQGKSATLAATADIDGQWQTGEQFFDPGQYTVTMTEYAAADTNHTTPLGSTSTALALTVTGGAAVRDIYVVPQGQTLQVAAPAGVQSNDAISGLAALSQGPANGHAQLQSDGSFVYTPNPGFSGTDHFIYRVHDANGNSAAARTTVHVAPTETDPATLAPNLDFDALPADLKLAAMHFAYLNEIPGLNDIAHWQQQLDSLPASQHAGVLKALATSMVASERGQLLHQKPWDPGTLSEQGITDFVQATWLRLFGHNPDTNTLYNWRDHVASTLYSGQSIVPLLSEMMESAHTHELTTLLSKATLGAHYLHLQQQFGKSLQPGNTVHDTLDQVTHTPDSLQASLAQLHSATMAELV